MTENTPAAQSETAAETAAAAADSATASAAAPSSAPATAYEALVPDARQIVDAFVASLRSDRNWKVRRKTLLDRLELLIQVWSLSEDNKDALLKDLEAKEQAEAESGGDSDAPTMEPAQPAADGGGEGGDGGQDDPGDGQDGDDREHEEKVADLTAMFITAILEQLGEERVTCPEQAAFYMLSLNPDDVAKLDAWLDLDRRNIKALRKMIRTDRRIKALLELMPQDFWGDPTQAPADDHAPAAETAADQD